MPLSIRVDGKWLHALGPYADVVMSHTWPRGSEELSWQMRRGVGHRVLSTGGALVEGFDGGLRVWHGRLSEPAVDGQYVANGLASQGAGVYALDASGNATVNVDTACNRAIIRDAVPWEQPASLLGAWGTASEPMKLFDLLDQAMAGIGQRWYVDADRNLRAASDPTVPRFLIPHVAAGLGLTLAEDDYYSNLVGTYLAAGPVFATVNAHLTAAGATSTNPADGDNPAKDRWGYKEERVDLTDMGVISAATAAAQLGGRLALTGARMGFAESLELGYGEITTRGGTPVPLSMVMACIETGGQMVRLMGVTDRTRPTSTNGSNPNTDIIIGRSEYREGAGTVTLTPLGKAPRDLRELLAIGTGT